MEIETLLTGSKWKILELLSEKEYSPIELSEKLNTTLANISQQLRLLETAGLVKKTLTHKNSPGQPRKKYSLSEDYAMIITITDGFAKKQLIKVDEKQKQQLKRWLR